MVGDSPPLNVRRVGESREIVKQTDFDLRLDVQAGPGGASRVLIHLCMSDPLCMTFVMGGKSHGSSRDSWVALGRTA